MRFLDYLRVAFKNLWRQKARSFLTVTAVVIGAISVVIMVSLVIGARGVFVKQIESIGGLTLISVTGDSEQSSDRLFQDSGGSDTAKKIDDAVIAELKRIEGVDGVTPLITYWANSLYLKADSSKKNRYANITGFDPDAGVFDMELAAGRALSKDDLGKIIVSSQTLRNLGFAGRADAIIGQSIIIGAKGGDVSAWEPDPPQPPQNADKEYWESQGRKTREIEAEVIGVMTSGMDDGRDFISLNWARQLMTTKRWEYDDSGRKAIEDQINQLNQQQMQMKGAGTLTNAAESSIRTQVEALEKQMNSAVNLRLVQDDQIIRNGYGAAMLKAETTDVVAKVGTVIREKGYGVTTAQEMLDGISKIFQMLGLLGGAIGGISLFVAAIGIINTMAMAIYERTREIGVMRACGARKATIRRLFTFESALLGFLGGAIGLLLSYGLAKIANYAANRFAVSLSVPIDNLISFPLWLILGIVAFTTAVGWLAGVIPAFRAARLDPVEALRYE